ncbi:hypothetical protein IV203_006477 [Nitzschia inconspicua]|uniref:Uncharacterized protein n=1 Tax=Nitzschia inconspicua TaxID=303405 RepID=A0A9K3KAP8_9STRA|nr:hypothetical protein IV203_006477 [Nitzschia inconspicua]
MSDDTVASFSAASATTSDATPTTCMDTSTATVEVPVPFAIAVDSNVFWPSSNSQDQPVTHSQQETVMQPSSAMIKTIHPQTAAANTAAKTQNNPLAVAYPIHSTTTTTQKTTSRNSSGNHSKTYLYSAIVALVIIVVTLVLVLLVNGKTSGPTTPTVTVYYDSFEAFCFTVTGFYALEQPWLNCRCDHDYYWVECRGTRPTNDHTLNKSTEDAVTNATTVLPGNAPLAVLKFQYDNINERNQTDYTVFTCECATQSCDPDTTQCFEVSGYRFSTPCRITNTIPWGESICTVSKTIEQDLSGNEDRFQDACQICGGIPGTDTELDGYYHFDTSNCESNLDHGSDNDNNNNNNNNNNLGQSYCVPSLIPHPDLLYGAMKPTAEPPNPTLLENMQTSIAFCNYMTNKYQKEIGGYTCTCIDEQNHPERYFGNVINTVQCRPVNDTLLKYVRWQRQYWPYDSDSFGLWSDGGTTWKAAPLINPFLLLGESCQCTEPTCTVSPVLCTALSYNLESFGCSVYDKLNATSVDGHCSSQMCTVCEWFLEDEETGVIRVDTSSCDGRQEACRQTDLFL